MNQKTLILLVVVAGAAAGGYYLYQKQKTATQPASNPVATTNPDQRNPATPENIIGEYISEGQRILEKFRNDFGGF